MTVLPQYTLTPAATGVGLPLVFNPLTQQGILVESFDGGEPGTANLLTDTPASYNGDIYRGYTLGPRDVQFGLFVAGNTQTDFLVTRDAYLAALPLGASVTLTVVRPDGVTRTISGVVSENSGASDEDSIGPTWQVFALTLHCSNPFWLSPSTTLSFGVLASKAFFAAPFFPVLLRGSSINQSVTVSVMGTQSAQPIWTLTGPFTGPVELLIPGGPKLTLNYSALAGEVVTIDCRAGAQSVISSTAGNLFPCLSSDSQLFPLPVGAVTLQGVVNGATSGTALLLTYAGLWQAI